MSTELLLHLLNITLTGLTIVYYYLYIVLIQPSAMEIPNGCNSEICVVQLEEMHWFKGKKLIT